MEMRSDANGIFPKTETYVVEDIDLVRGDDCTEARHEAIQIAFQSESLISLIRLRLDGTRLPFAVVNAYFVIAGALGLLQLNGVH